MLNNKNNTGNGNTGDRNTGDYNTGYYNTGDRNTGDCNTGDYNTGYYNTGDRNTGDYNTGDYNTGYRNTGNYNTGDRNTGYFNTTTPKVTLFNGSSDLEFDSDMIAKLNSIVWNNVKPICTLIYKDDMTEKEKIENPTYETTGGYLKVRDYQYCWQKGWAKMSDEDKQFIKDLPNFCPKIFEEITGINVDDKKKKVTLELTDEQLNEIQDILNK